MRIDEFTRLLSTGFPRTPVNRPARSVVVLWGPLGVATVALFWIVPAFPLLHLDDPSHWGVIGYVVALGILVSRAVAGRVGLPKRLLAQFLAGMPVIYVANWFRFGGGTGWLAIEMAGLVGFGVVAAAGISRAVWLLPLGIAAHGLWDAWHFGTSAYVPDWYVIGCIVIDVALGGYAAAVYLLTRDTRLEPAR